MSSRRTMGDDPSRDGRSLRMTLILAEEEIRNCNKIVILRALIPADELGRDLGRLSLIQHSNLIRLLSPLVVVHYHHY